MALPLGRQDSIISIDSMKNCGMPPPFVTWAEALSTQKGRRSGSVARREGREAKASPPLACQPKCGIRKISRF